MILHYFIILTCHVPAAAAARKVPINDAQPNYSLHGNCIMVLIVRTPRAQSWKPGEMKPRRRRG